MSLPVIILGSGGHAKVLIEALRCAGAAILGMTDANPAKHGTSVLGVPVLGNDAEVDRYPPGSVLLVNGVGSVSRPTIRTSLFGSFKARGYSFATVIHPSAVIASGIVIGEGTQIMAGVVIQPSCRIGRNIIVNTGVCVDHDCDIGDHVHLAPGVVLSGDVSIGAGSHVGTGATVIQGVQIGRDSIIGAGSLVLKGITDGITVAGNPAKVLEK